MNRLCRLSRSAQQLQRLPTVGYINLGMVDYRRALRLQEQLVRHRTNHIHNFCDTLILIQHPPVYTNGRRNHHKLTSKEISRLRSLQADYVETNRGGEITFHGPGQLVMYPSMYLKPHGLLTKCYVEGLEQTIVEVCRRLGVTASSMEGYPGVWVSDTQKVAALGTRVQRYVTSHGVALNCSTDLRWFQEIVPCGLEGRTAVSLQQLLNRNITVEEVIPLAVDSFSQVFGCPVLPLQQVSRETYEFIKSL